MRYRSVCAHRYHIVDIGCHVIWIGGGGRTYSADNVRITSRVIGLKNARVVSARGIVGESKHYGAGGRRNDCEFVCGNSCLFSYWVGLRTE